MNPNFQQSWSPSAVFSPSAARQQLLEAKDWTYIDQWLTSHYRPNPVPPFERNPATLKALLALASANETADEEVALKRQVQAKALRELKDRHDALENSPPTALTLLADSLPPDGLLALHSLSLLTVALSLPHPSPSPSPTALATALTALTAAEARLAQQTHHLTTQHHKLQLQLSRARAALTPLTLPPPSPATFHPSPLLPQQTLEWTHASRVLAQKSSEYASRAAALQRRVPSETRLGTLGIKRLEEEERGIAELKEVVLGLEGQVKAFQGLPPDRDVARLEVERVEGLWREVEGRKEGVYDRLVR